MYAYLEPRLGRDIAHLIGSYSQPKECNHATVMKQLTDRFCYSCYKLSSQLTLCDCCSHPYCSDCISKFKIKRLWSTKFHLTPGTKMSLCPCHHLNQSIYMRSTRIPVKCVPRSQISEIIE